MKTAVIGAGFGGLAAAYKLAKSGTDVTVFEADDKPGGLAVGFKDKKWSWTVEKHYHHWFVSDKSVRNLAKDVGHDVIFVRPVTSTFIDGDIFQLDSPLSLLTFPKLSLADRFRTGVVLAYLKISPYWRVLENITAEDFIKRYMGVSSWQVLWKPLFEKKFSRFSDKIPASWFWARIKKRSAALGYPVGGFLAFAETLDKKIRRLGGKIYYKYSVMSIKKQNQKFNLVTDKGEFVFDKIICTLPSPLFVKITEGMPKDYVRKLLSLDGIGAVNLMLSLSDSFLESGVYWLNVNNKDMPFVSVVEHTNFMSIKNYNNQNLLYIGNYLPHDHRFFKMDEKGLLNLFMPHLKKINPKFSKKWINKIYLFKAFFAQPIIPLNYSKILPDFKTPFDGLYLCNIQQVYPWDRGTNYAVENGERVAEMVLKSK